MKTYIHDLLSLLARWRAEHARVLDAAGVVNLARLRAITPLVAALNAVHVLVFLVQLADAPVDSNQQRWALGLLVTHLIMGLTMLTVALLARHLHRTHQARWGQRMAVAVAATSMGFAIAVACIDQWITPAITPFLITSAVVGVGLYIRPRVAFWLYLATCVAFSLAIGLTQHDPAQLLSNRLNGVTACLMGAMLSVLLWRKFTTITLQQAQLEKANAELLVRQREMERLTRQDGLTGLFNRNTFVDLTRRELDRAQRQGSATTILLLDLDHFKRVNDTWGHPAGDAVLRHVATLASTTVRSTDLVGRLGGEEFIIMLPNTSVQAARTLAEKLRQRLEASPLQWEHLTIPVTTSIGLAGTTAQEKHDFDSLYSQADKALYQAKQLGRNRVV
jgi:diguanylate cyclase (GGDEF)-like protein